MASTKGNSFFTEAPDRGWSWIVAVSCCLINMLFIGAMRIGSLLFVATVKSLNISRKEASIPFSLASALKCFCGPLAGFLADRFGIRLITLIGGILGAFGIGMCFFADQIIQITIFWGVFFGIGYSLGSTVLPAIINEYFDTYRARAMGISHSGMCLGSFVLPLLVEYCLREYDLSGTFIILSGILLNCVPLAVLLRKPSFIGKNAPSKCTPSHVTDEHPSGNCCLKNENINCGKVHGTLSTIFTGNVKEINSLSSTTPLAEIIELPSLVSFKCLREKSESNLLCEANLKKCDTPEGDIFTIAGNIQCHAIENEKSQNTSLSSMNETKTIKSETEIVHYSFRKKMALFRNPMFILIGMSRALYCVNFLSIFTVLADFAIDIGIEMPKTPYILMSFSVGEFLGTMCLGLFVDKKCMTVMQFIATFFLFLALFVASLAWAAGFWYLVAASFAYGVCGAGVFLSIPLLIAECIDTKLQTIAMPSIHIFTGFTFLTIPKLIEIFREQLGSYIGLFYTMSAISLICAATWFILPFCMKRRS